MGSAGKWRGNPVKTQIMYATILVAVGVVIFVAGALLNVKLLEILGALIMAISPYIAVALTVRGER
ncbi:MAG: hypothetical protein F7C35_02300 [Desulfurococcales archaeon]|nr:hypothetical protein [Desulfurococcales archaeon]